MAENAENQADSTTAVEEQPYDYPIRVEDAGARWQLGGPPDAPAPEARSEPAPRARVGVRLLPAALVTRVAVRTVVRGVVGGQRRARGLRGGLGKAARGTAHHPKFSRQVVQAIVRGEQALHDTCSTQRTFLVLLGNGLPTAVGEVTRDGRSLTVRVAGAYSPIFGHFDNYGLGRQSYLDY